MRIAYINLQKHELQKLEKNKQVEEILTANGVDLENTRYVAVYEVSEKGFDFSCVFEILRNKKGLSLKKKRKIKRPVDDIHKFWARKPWWAVSQYILKYSKIGDVIFDPMCGCGIVGYEALRLRRRAILADLNPFAIFLARNTIRPINLKELLKSFEEVLERKIDRDIKTKDGRIIIPKGTKVGDAISSLYKTKCDKCGRETDVIYYVWDTVYQFTGRNPGTVKDRILLKAISRVKGIKTIPQTISQHWLLKNWERILKEAKHLWISKHPREENPFKLPRPSTVTQPFGLLVREGCYRRVKREPVLIYFKCGNKKCAAHKGSFKELDEEDWKLIEILEKIEIPFEYPQTPLSYPNGKLFDTARPDSVFIKEEKLATWEESDLLQRNLKIHHLFTKRNLLALAILYWSIKKERNKLVKEPLLLAFTSTLLHSSKLISSQLVYENGKIRRIGGAIWMQNRYSVPPDFKEENVFMSFDKEFLRIYKAQEETNKEIKNYNEAFNDPEKFVKNNKISILYLVIDARKIKSIFKKYKDIVDMVFTDPPYGDAIQYFELCTFFTSWLLLDDEWRKTYGDGDWWKEELIVNDVRNKTLEDFARELRDAFLSVSHIVKPDANWVITYHKREPKYWNALTDCLLGVGLNFYHEERHELLVKGFNPSKDFRFLEADAYTVWKKPVATIKIKTISKAAEEFFAIIEPYAIRHKGVLPKEVIEKAYIEMAWKTEKNIYSIFFEHKFDTFLQKHFVQIISKDGAFYIPKRDAAPPTLPTRKWKELWDKVYEKIPLEDFLRTALYAFIKSKNEKEEKALLDDIYHEVIDRVDGRINKHLVMRVLEEIAEWDWIRGYVIKEKIPRELKKQVTLIEWMKPKKAEKYPDPPEKLVPFLAEGLLKNGFKVYISEEYELPKLPRVFKRNLIRKETIEFKKFPLVIKKNKERICIDINRMSLASSILISRRGKVIILYGDEKFKEDFEYFRSQIESKELIPLDVRGKDSEEVRDSILKILKEV